MPIAMTDGTTYENSLDMLFAKDMPSREETTRQQQDKRTQELTDGLDAQERHKALEENMPPDMRGPPLKGNPFPTPSENEQLQPQDDVKDQNDPYYWGYGSAKDREGPAMVPYPTPKFHEIMNQMDELINPGSTLPANARPTAAEFDQLPSAIDIPKDTEVKQAPSESIFTKENYDKVTNWIDKNLPKAPGQELAEGIQEGKYGVRELLGLMLSTAMQGIGGAGTLGRTPVEPPPKFNATSREAFRSMIKDKMAAAQEGGEVPQSDITNPTISGLKEGSPWGKKVTNEDGTTSIVPDKKKLNQIERMWKNGNTYQEMADEFDVSRGSIASVVKQMGLKRWDPRGDNRTGKTTKDAEFSPEDMQRGVTEEGGSEGKPWTPIEDKVLKSWYLDPNGDLAEIPKMLGHRSEKAIFDRARQKGYDQYVTPDTNEEPSAKAFVPKGALRAPEKGSGSGAVVGPEDLGLSGKSGISTPNRINTQDDIKANNNTSLQIDDPVAGAAIDKSWENFGRANRDNLPLISPAIEGKLKEMNPAGFKKLKQFELEMDYKYKQPQGRRHWLSDLTPEEADRYRTLYNNVDRIRPVQEQALGGNPREKAIREKNSTYPTTEDAYAARAFEQFAGEDVESYTKGKVARILGSVDKTGKVIPKAGLTDDLEEFMRGIMKESVSKNVDLTKKANWKYADKLADEFTKAAIVAKRVPIAGLGFDPSRVVADVKMDDIAKSTIGGAYMAPGKEGKGSDATYVNFQGGGTMIHESIHRGLEKLRDRKDLRGAFANLPADEESLTRYIMYKHAGDPEGDAGSVDAKQRADAIRMFEDTEGKTWARYEEAINKITKAAQDEIKKRRPGGHR